MWVEAARLVAVNVSRKCDVLKLKRLCSQAATGKPVKHSQLLIRDFKSYDIAPRPGRNVPFDWIEWYLVNLAAHGLFSSNNLIIVVDVLCCHTEKARSGVDKKH
jgi:hypothetical protein